ncbi:MULTISPECIES: hypothetical protein [Basfia]|nr:MULTISPECIES: hypothetical protein [Basfia]SEQ32079.1 hypothetical protein SAMN02910415_01257 [Basfia succiniciproducens]
MKKVTLTIAMIVGLGLTACSGSQKQYDDGYAGEILFSQYEGSNLKLTVRYNNCDGKEGKVENLVITQPYDSDLPVGACVRVSTAEDGTKNIRNISRSVSRSWLSRTGIIR